MGALELLVGILQVDVGVDVEEEYHNDNAFDPARESFGTAFTPVIRRLGLLAQHHC